MPRNHRDDAPLTGAQERAVRDLLASARHDEPLPDEVAAQLDARLAELTAVRRELRPQDRPDGAPVVSLAARRRRRVLTGLVAAAAVVVVGTGLGQLLPDDVLSSGGGSDSAVSTESGADAGAGDESLADLEATDSRRDRQRRATSESSADQAELPPGLPRIASDRLVRGALRVRARELNATSLNNYREQSDGLAAGATCDGELVGRGRRVLVDHAGTPAVLVFARPDGDVQTVDLLACGSGERLRRAELPAP